MTQMLQTCWDFMQQDCYMVCAYWSDFKLSLPATLVVIKLLFKIGDQMFLKNWCSILPFTLACKIIAKKIANKLQKFLPMVDSQQTGFIEGFNIQNNFLTSKFT